MKLIIEEKINEPICTAFIDVSNKDIRQMELTFRNIQKKKSIPTKKN